MHEFTSVDWFHITGRGWAASVREPFPGTREDWEPWEWAGKKTVVKIDGHDYLVKGVETFLNPRSPDRPYTGSFAILVGKDEINLLRHIKHFHEDLILRGLESQDIPMMRQALKTWLEIMNRINGLNK